MSRAAGGAQSDFSLTVQSENVASRLRSLAWMVWTAAFACASASVFKWHLQYFKSPGPQFYHVALVFVPALALTALLHSLPRMRPIWCFELMAGALLSGLACCWYEPRAAAVTAIIFLAFSAAGGGIRQRLGLHLENPLDRLTFNFGAGAGLAILALAGLGLLDQLRSWELVVLVALPLLIFRSSVAGTIADLYSAWRSLRRAELAHPLLGPALVFGSLAAVCSLMIVLAPSIAFDSIANHLPLVQFYASQHAVKALPSFGYSYYPQGMELVWTLAFTFAGQPGAQLTSGLFFLFFLLGLFRLSRMCGLSPSAALIALACCATLPFLHWSGSVMKNDLALAFFELLSLASFIRWLDAGDARWMAASGFFLGQAFGVKLVALFAAPAMAVLWMLAMVRRRSSWRSSWMVVAAIMAAFVAAYGVWPARAYFLTGNPVEPEHFRTAAPRSLEIYKTAPVSRLAAYAVQVRNIFTGSRSQFESPLPHPSGILLAAFAPLLLWYGARPRTPPQRACAVFAVIYLLYWMSILTKVRYAILPFALVAVAAAAVMVRFYDRQEGAWGKAARASLLGLQTYCFTVALMGLMIVGVNGPQFRYFAGKIGKTAYLRSAMQAYGAVAYLWTIHRPDARVYGVNDVARAYAPNPLGFDGVDCVSNRCDLTRIAGDVKAQAAEYLILPTGDAYRRLLEQLGRAEPVYHDDYFSVYHLSH